MADIKNIHTIKEAESLIRGIGTFGNIKPLPHCWKRMRQKNYDLQDIYFLLSTGKINEPPEYDENLDNWKWKVEGKVIDGDKATVIVIIVSHRELKCKTMW